MIAAARPPLAVILALALLPLAAAAQGLDDRALDAALDGHLSFLASDVLGGRETGTPLGDVTALYVASEMRQIGLQPAGDPGEHLQAYEVVWTGLDRERTALRLSAGGDERGLVLGDDFVLSGWGAGGIDLQAGAVLVGRAPRGGGADVYAGADAAGRLAIVIEEAGDEALAWSRRGLREGARGAGAAGLVLVAAQDSRQSGGMRRWMAAGMAHRSMSLRSDEPGFPFVILTPEAGAGLLAACGVDAGAERAARAGDAMVAARELAGARLVLRAPVTDETRVVHNAAGLLPGSDPELAHEVVVVSAHMDHIGTEDDGRVNNGADDNASGTAVLLSVAADMAARGAPRRSVLFLSVSGEEKNLLGSAHWVAHPTVDLARVVADVNIDMVGRNDPDALGATPSPTHPEHNTLVQRAVELAPSSGLRVEWEAGEGDLRRRVDDYFHRSDHANFAAAGIPVVFFFAGEHADYHQTTDTLEKLDRGKLRRVARFVADLVRDAADADARPRRLQP